MNKKLHIALVAPCEDLALNDACLYNIKETLRKAPTKYDVSIYWSPATNYDRDSVPHEIFLVCQGYLRVYKHYEAERARINNELLDGLTTVGQEAEVSLLARSKKDAEYERIYGSH